MEDYLALESRRKIYDLIEKNPGLHLSKIAFLLNIRKSLLEYHLLYLEKNQVITATKEEGFTRYYVVGKIGVKEKKLLSLLRQDIPLRIILFLLQHSQAKHKEILENFTIAASTLSYHLKKLVKSGIVMVIVEGEEKKYFVSNEQEIIGLRIRYKPYYALDSFQDIWKDLY